MKQEVRAPAVRKNGKSRRSAHGNVPHCEAPPATDESPEADPLGPKLLAIRKRLRMNQKQFAEAIGTSQSALVTYEKTQREPPVRILCKAARLADLSLDELLLSPIDSCHYRAQSWLQGEALKRRLLELATMERASLDLDEDRWLKVMRFLFMTGAQVRTNEMPFRIVVALCQTPDDGTPE